MSTDLLRVGVIGVGMIALINRIPDLQRIGRAEIVAICRRDAEALRRTQELLGVPQAYTDWREMLDRADLDAVLVCTPHHLHYEQTMAALERGLHVFVEKPLALAPGDAWQIALAAEQAERVVTIGCATRFTGQWRTAVRLLSEGTIGPIRQVTVALSYPRWWLGTELESDALRHTIAGMAVPLYKQAGVPAAFYEDWTEEGNWHMDPARIGGGALANAGQHGLDLALWLGGAPPTDVAAIEETAGAPVERFIAIQARLANGVLLSLTSADMRVEGRRVAVYGDHGILTADTMTGGSVYLHRGGASEQIEPRVDNVSACGAFVSAVTEGTPNLSPPRDGAHAVALLEAAYRSARENKMVRVEPPMA
ncbi:MAG: Gfo/Idh/MocA family oxidoreductase [Anaerolineae bacterium]|nr:Gfo/Idh/MocA family oxidoreductase [Anaerolineae bacterium]